MPLPLHGNLLRVFSKKLYGIISTLPAAVDSRISVEPNEDTPGFTGPYEGSVKTPDLKVSFKDGNGNRKVRLVLEVGFAENYDDLIGDAQLCLNRMKSVGVVVLANYREPLDYKNPLSEKNEKKLQFNDISAVQPSHFIMQGEYGPVVYGNFTWAGKISEAFIEIWKKRSETGIVEKCGNWIVSVLLLNLWLVD